MLQYCNEYRERFDRDGLLLACLSERQQAGHLFIWLQDAENNLLSTRKQLAKLQRQYNADLNDAERSVRYWRNQCSDNAGGMATGSIVSHSDSVDDAVREQAPCSAQYELIVKMLEHAGLSSEQVNAVKSQIVQLLGRRVLLPDTNNDDDGDDDGDGQNTEQQLIKIQDANRQLTELLQRQCDKSEHLSESCSLLQRSNKHLSLENEKLIFKLSELMLEIEQREHELKNARVSSCSCITTATNAGNTAAGDINGALTRPACDNGGERVSAGDKCELLARKLVIVKSRAKLRVNELREQNRKTVERLHARNAELEHQLRLTAAQLRQSDELYTASQQQLTRVVSQRIQADTRACDALADVQELRIKLKECQQLVADCSIPHRINGRPDPVPEQETSLGNLGSGDGQQENKELKNTERRNWCSVAAQNRRRCANNEFGYCDKCGSPLTFASNYDGSQVSNARAYCSSLPLTLSVPSSNPLFRRYLSADNLSVAGFI